MRYFFGQRLGVVDFSDEQSYLVGKQRVANRSLHGAGVVCGLRAERFVFPQGSPPTTPTTVVRLFRGAAIDSCGREVIVGADQCIDVNAWFQVNRARPELSSIPLPATLPLCIGLRYRECPADPAPAPRDPCGCDTGGCEFGRVRESFQLTLLTESEQANCSFTLPPTLADVAREHSLLLAETPLAVPTAGSLLTAVHRAIAAGCQDARTDTWLCLACMDAAVGADGIVTDVTNIRNSGPDRRSLLPTGTLQEMLLGAVNGPGPGAVSFGGPTIGSVTFEGSGLTAGQFRIAVQLGQQGSPPGASPLAAGTLQSGYVRLLQFEDAPVQWSAVAQSGFAFDGTVDPPLIRVDYSTLVAGGRYRLVFESPLDEPVADERMRPISPATFALHVRLVDTSGTLTATSALF
jgi:hypothetical protein